MYIFAPAWGWACISGLEDILFGFGWEYTLEYQGKCKVFLAVSKPKVDFSEFQICFIVKMGGLKNGMRMALNGLQL